MTKPRRLPTIDQLLEEAAIPVDDVFTDDDVAEWCAIATAAYNAPRLDLATDAADEPGTRFGKPGEVATTATYVSDHEQAVHDLSLAVSVIISTPLTAATLQQVLIDAEHIEPEGGLVIGCLLHLIGNTDGAIFWWRYAADGDIKQAAFCLYLFHVSCAEYRDAEYWRMKCRGVSDSTLKGEIYKKSEPVPVAENVRRTLLDQCQRTGHPQLPHAVEEVLNTAVGDGDLRDPSPLSGIRSPLADVLC